MSNHQQLPSLAVGSAATALASTEWVGAGAGAGDGSGRPPVQRVGYGGALGGEGHAQHTEDEVEQLRADVNALRGKCDQLETTLAAVRATCNSLQATNNEHETMLASLAPKLERLDALFRSSASGPHGGDLSLLSGPKASVSSQQTAKRISWQWSKDHVRRWYAVARMLPEVSEHRLAEIVGGDAVVTPAVHKMLNKFGGWKIGSFDLKRVDKAAGAFTNERFAALVRCVEAFIEASGGRLAITAAQDFLQEFRNMSSALNTYFLEHRSAFYSEDDSGAGTIMTSRLENALDADLAAITKVVGDAANELKTSFRDEPPAEGDVLPAVPPPEFSKTLGAINDVTGVHQIAALMRAVRSGRSAGNFGFVEGGVESAAKKPRMAYK